MAGFISAIFTGSEGMDRIVFLSNERTRTVY